MSGFVKLALRLIILCVLVIGAVLLSQPPAVLADRACCDGCSSTEESCIEFCFGDTHCVQNCINAEIACIERCGNCN